MGLWSALMKGAAVGLMGFEIGQKFPTGDHQHPNIQSKAQYTELLENMESSIIMLFFVIAMMLIITISCFSLKCYNKISDRLSYRPSPAARVVYANNPD